MVSPGVQSTLALNRTYILAKLPFSNILCRVEDGHFCYNTTYAFLKNHQGQQNHGACRKKRIRGIILKNFISDILKEEKIGTQ